MTGRHDVLKAVQQRLADLGYYTGRVDGIDGPLTSLAVQDFKRASGLNPRDFVGPITLTRLFDEDTEPRNRRRGSRRTPKWVTIAMDLLGTREAPGAANNPLILDWAHDLDQWYPGDDIAWCGLFVAHCMAIGAPLDPQDFNRLGARAWLNYGQPCGEEYGAIAVFWRGDRNGPYGHVGFAVGQDKDTITVLGGNQSDSVSMARIDRGRLLGFRWPKSVALPGLGLGSGVSAPLSVSEA